MAEMTVRRKKDVVQKGVLCWAKLAALSSAFWITECAHSEIVSSQ